MVLDHIEHMSYFDLLTASKSGAVAIVCPEGKPSLSIVYPGTDRPPMVVSNDQVYSSALFIKTPEEKSGIECEFPMDSSTGHGIEVCHKSSGVMEGMEKGAAKDELVSTSKEKLAATCTNNKSIHLWNLDELTSSVTCKMKAAETSELMNLCIIDDTTVAYGDMYPKPDGTHKVYIVNTSTDRWSLRSTLILDIRNIWDMCFIKTTDGTSCLVLSCPSEHCVNAVELVCNLWPWNILIRKRHKFVYIIYSVSYCPCQYKIVTRYLTKHDSFKHGSLFFIYTLDCCSCDECTYAITRIHIKAGVIPGSPFIGRRQNQMEIWRRCHGEGVLPLEHL